MRTGVTSTTTQSLLLGPGVIYKDFISPTTPGTIIGATLGGTEVSIERELFDPEFDGIPGPLKGSTRIVKESAKVKAKIVEINKDTLMLALAGTSVSTVGNHSKITSGLTVSAGNHKDIAVVADISGKSQPIIFVVKNALATEPVEISTGTGKEDVAFEVTFTGYYDPSNPSVAPYEIYTPNA